MTPFQRPLLRQAKAGFTIMEMMFVMSIFAILFASSLSLSRSVLDREELNGLAIGLAGWLEAIQRGAQRTTGGCTVTFAAGINTPSGLSLRTGDTLATVTPSNCTNEPSFLIPSLRSDGTLTARFNPTQFRSITFTPRGTLAAISRYLVQYSHGPVISFKHSSVNFARCVRITNTSGYITLGAKNSGSTCYSDDSNFPDDFDGTI
jgi:prepilin-type N-terminal cleavage/methylation domain-containing protein